MVIGIITGRHSRHNHLLENVITPISYLTTERYHPLPSSNSNEGEIKTLSSFFVMEIPE
jgi:hypothetical protein